jgi:hypothetical protein
MILSSFLGVNGDIFALGGQATNKCEYFSPQGREKYSHLFFWLIELAPNGARSTASFWSLVTFLFRRIVIIIILLVD